jgi:hypothetical protein
MPKGIPEAPELDVGVTLEERDSVLSMMPHFTLGPPFVQPKLHVLYTCYLFADVKKIS